MRSTNDIAVGDMIRIRTPWGYRMKEVTQVIVGKDTTFLILDSGRSVMSMDANRLEWRSGWVERGE